VKYSFLLVATAALLTGCGESPTADEPLSMTGVWEESFLAPQFDIAHIEKIDDDPILDTVRITATLTMENGRFTAETDRHVSPWPFFHQPPPVEGCYRLHGDTVTFWETGYTASAQDFAFQLQYEELTLHYLTFTDTLDTGATVSPLPMGCLPWHNSFLKHSGTFTRME
jgi:hypothetical protein